MNLPIKVIISFLFVLLSININAQVAINTTNIDASAALKIHADDMGVLLPKVMLTSTTDVVTIPAPATSLIVYNENVVNDVIEGYYYWDGVRWALLTDNKKKYARAKFCNASATSSMNLNTTVLAPVMATTVYNSDTSLFTNNTNTVTVNEGGRYQIVVHLYLHTKTDKIQPYCQLNINGIPKGAIAATGYINRDDGNWDSSLQLYETFNLNKGDEITLQMNSHYSGFVRFTSTGTSYITVTKLQ
jgi:hypothetical protein